MFLLCLTHFERMPCNKVDSLGVPTCNVSIVFYTLSRGCRVTKVIPWECPPSTCLLCFTRFERMPGNKGDSLGVPTFNVSIMFYTL
jgi:hypothetical protein